VTRTWHLFDFDGTLIRGDSTLPLGLALARHRPWRLPAASVLALSIKLARSPDELQVAKCRFLGYLLKGLDERTVVSIATSVANRLSLTCNPVAMARLDELARNRASVIVATASPVFLIRVFLRRYPEVTVVGTDFECVSGHYSGGTLGPPCFGPLKLPAIAKVLGEGATIGEGWSDSPSDLPMMSLAASRYWVVRGAERERIGRLDPLGNLVEA